LCLQQILDDLDAAKIEAMVRQWLARLPHPFSAQDRAAGFRYRLSILPGEFARTEVFDRPLSGRPLFEQVIRENLDLGRPEKVTLIFRLMGSKVWRAWVTPIESTGRRYHSHGLPHEPINFLLFVQDFRR
jgi:hypothetical protein